MMIFILKLELPTEKVTMLILICIAEHQSDHTHTHFPHTQNTRMLTHILFVSLVADIHSLIEVTLPTSVYEGKSLL